MESIQDLFRKSIIGQYADETAKVEFKYLHKAPAGRAVAGLHSGITLPIKECNSHAGVEATTKKSIQKSVVKSETVVNKQFIR